MATQSITLIYNWFASRHTIFAFKLFGRACMSSKEDPYLVTIVPDSDFVRSLATLESRSARRSAVKRALDRANTNTLVKRAREMLNSGEIATRELVVWVFDKFVKRARALLPTTSSARESYDANIQFSDEIASQIYFEMVPNARLTNLFKATPEIMDELQDWEYFRYWLLGRVGYDTQGDLGNPLMKYLQEVQEGTFSAKTDGIVV